MTGRRARCVTVVGVLLAAAGCAPPDPLITERRIAIRLPDDPACRPDAEPSEIRVQALGDFPPSDPLIELVLPGRPPREVDRFPLGTELLSFEGLALPSWRGAAVYRVPDGEDPDGAVLLTPIGRRCAIRDPEVRLPRGAAVSDLPGGGLLVAGGLPVDGGTAQRRTVRVPLDGSLADVLGEPLSQERTEATATRSGDRVLIAGGSLEAVGAALSSFEVFDAEGGVFDPEAEGNLPDGGRRDHGAGVLADGRVLLVGGTRRDDADPLQSAVVVDPQSGEAVVLEGELPHGRLRPHVLTLDDGNTYVVGGVGAGGANTGNVLWADVDAGTFVDAEATGLPDGRDRPFPYREHAVAVGLPGARIAWVGGAATVELLLFGDGPLGPAWVELDLVGELPVLEEVVAEGLPDGRILLSGRRTDGSTAAFLVDPSTASVVPLEAPSVLPDRALGVSGGLVVELSDSGAAYRRVLLRTPFDNPPATLLPSDRAWLALDASPRWRTDPVLEARTDTAWLHLPTLRLGDFRVSVDLEGPADLVLRGAGGATQLVGLDAGRTRVGLCELSHPEDAEVVVTRRDDTVVLSTGEVEQRCAVDLPGRVGLSLRALRDTRVDALRLERL